MCFYECKSNKNDDKKKKTERKIENWIFLLVKQQIEKHSSQHAPLHPLPQRLSPLSNGELHILLHICLFLCALCSIVVVGNMTTSVLNNNNNNSSSSGNKNSSTSTTNNNNNTINNNTKNNNNNSCNNNNNNNSSSSDLATTTTTTTSGSTTTATTAATAAATTTTAANRSMQSDEDFNIRFVNLVRTHKCLYDKKVPEYRNRDNQEKAWMLISQETCESVIHCKERWRNLRACLSRYIKQQSGADPQHKPYYLTEHMSFLLPFLKSTRNTLEAAAAAAAGSNSKASLAVLLQLSQQQHNQEQQPTSSNSLHMLPLHLQLPHASMVAAVAAAAAAATATSHDEFQDMKHSLSENEETIDAFDPVISASMQQLHEQQQHDHHHNHSACSPPLSDTASANSITNFIPDVQLAELRTPEPPATTVADMFAVGAQTSGRHQHQHQHQLQQQQQQMLIVNGVDAHHEYNNVSGGSIASSSAPKRIKTECHANDGSAATSTAALHCYGSEHAADMDFFRSIMPDIAALTPQQKRKLKIGILELIDDVVDRFPGGSGAGERGSSTGTGSGSATTVTANGTFMGNGSSGSTANGSGGGGVGGGGGSSVGSSSNFRAQQQQQQQQQSRNSGRDWRK